MHEQIHKTILPNGLRIISVPMDTPSASVLILVGAGSRYETDKQAGLSHFLEHMMFKGTKERPTAIEIAQEIDGIGGVNNAYTSKDYTGYYIKAASKHVSHMIEILADMTLNSLLKQEEIDREKGVIIQEMMMYEDTPMRIIEEYFEGSLYGKKTALGRQIIGDKSTIRSFSHDDFKAYMNTFYRPSNTVVIVSGGVPAHKHISQLVEDEFGSWNDSSVPTFDNAELVRNQQITIYRKETEQTHVCIGTHAYSRTDKRRHALNILAAVLGGGMSSRLFHQVRERRGLAYYVKSWINKYQDTGNFVTQAGVDKKNLEEAIRVIMTEFQKISKKGYKLPAKELKKAKEFVKGHIILSMEDSMTVAEYIGRGALLDGKYTTLKQTLSFIDKVTVEDIADVSKDILKNKKLHVTAIGPIPNGAEKKIESIISS